MTDTVVTRVIGEQEYRKTSAGAADTVMADAVTATVAAVPTGTTSGETGPADVGAQASAQAGLSAAFSVFGGLGSGGLGAGGLSAGSGTNGISALSSTSGNDGKAGSTDDDQAAGGFASLLGGGTTTERESAAAVEVRNVVTDETTVIPANGIFVAIGHVPQTGFLDSAVSRDDDGYILVDGASTRTSVLGVFAAGDAVDRVYRQAISAAGMGCRAALDAQEYLAR
ncbi:hypothetical protein CSQ87_03490 [Bifidobacterium simiarum]|uniref:FAD/NAD(P)-binding domain-containing protein n=2 Tax=Bifidobacterium simiarum TaxID=2045441 RepID=A0A2M9HGQ7_9BIFI|nr:hypothetical protein CSQ87_03490 [Bifidobacterium simiarum]